MSSVVLSLSELCGAELRAAAHPSCVNMADGHPALVLALPEGREKGIRPRCRNNVSKSRLGKK